MNKLDFNNQNIIVTGGSSGIGEASLFSFAETFSTNWTAKKCPPVVERRPEACAFVGKITDEIDFYPDLLAQNFLKMPVPLVWDRLASENDRRTFFQGPIHVSATFS